MVRNDQQGALELVRFERQSAGSTSANAQPEAAAWMIDERVEHGSLHSRVKAMAPEIIGPGRVVAASGSHWPAGLRLVLALDNTCFNTYLHVMNTRLRDEIKQTRPFGSLEQEAYLSLGRTWAILEHGTAEALKAHGITPTQYNVLRILRGAGRAGLCRNEVMERMVARVPDATRLLDRLEGAGLIARERSSEDRRFVATRITPAGRRMLAKLDEPIQALHQRQFANLNQRDLRRLVELLGLARQAE
jgi:DNA-binding MarR family transcriptional regulator